MRGSRRNGLVKRYEISLFSRILHNLECNQDRILKHHHETKCLDAVLLTLNGDKIVEHPFFDH